MIRSSGAAAFALALHALSVGLSTGESFTATAHLPRLIEVEGHLVEKLRLYVEESSAYLAQLRAFAGKVREERTLNATRLTQSVTGRLRTVQRLATEWWLLRSRIPDRQSKEAAGM